jgi:hypothetical protein
VSKRLLFVSCGQSTGEEKRLGHVIEEEINATEIFEAYFAESVQSVESLGAHILDALRRCAGAVLILHGRGRVRTENGQELVHSSVWINQEIAILAYRQFFEASEIPILVFKEPSVVLEGAMTAFIANPKPLIGVESVASAVRLWLDTEARRGRSDDHEIFQQKWRALSQNDYALIRALIAEGGREVKEATVRRRLGESTSADEKAASRDLPRVLAVLSQATLVQRRHNLFDRDEISLHPKWEWYVRYASSHAQ